MKKQYTVKKAYTCENENPITLIKGDTVQLGEKSNDNGPWPNWIYCISYRTQKEGWTPVQVLRIEDKVGVATTDYDAKEMTVFEGDELKGSMELNGWIWCSRQRDNDESIDKKIVEEKIKEEMVKVDYWATLGIGVQNYYL